MAGEVRCRASRGAVDVRRVRLGQEGSETVERFIELDPEPRHSLARAHEQKAWEASLGQQLPTDLGPAVKPLELDGAQHAKRSSAESDRVVVEWVPI